MMKVKNTLTEIIQKFDSCTKNPTSFLNTQTQLEEDIRCQLKSLYDLAKKSEDKSIRGASTVPRLITYNFDTEQLWQQLEIQNQVFCSEIQKKLSLKLDDTNAVLNLSEKSSDSEVDELSDSDVTEKEDGNSLEGEASDDVSLDAMKEGEEKEYEDDIKVDHEQMDGAEDEYDQTDNKNEGQRSVGFNFDTDKKEITSKFSISTGEVKTTFEKRQERVQERVKKLEEELLAKKPWQLKGEVTAKTRPQNSLLEEVLEFDVTSRPAPIISEEAAIKLEDIIIRRIKDMAWDDVVKKIKPVDTPLEYKKKLVLDQEKSKLSLAKVYEEEYLKQKEGIDPDNKFKQEEEPKEHKQLRVLLDSLFRKLDSLSNYHYTPIPAVPELQIVNNLPAVTMEEAIPAAVSNATLLAPEEVQDKKKGELKAKEERTTTDKNRSRRKKKLKQKFKKNAIETRQKYLQKVKYTKSTKYGREKLKMELEKLGKNSSVSHFQEDEINLKATKSSKQFFNRLQNTVSNDTKLKRKNENVKYDAKKIKL